MHELSLCENLLDQVIKIAQQHQAKNIESITLNLGPLAGVEPLLLDNAFKILKIDTVVANAQLIINSTPIIIKCQQCGEQSSATNNYLVCPSCQSNDTQLISGDELTLASVALYTAT